MTVEPVQIEVVRECHYRAKPCRACGRAPSAHKKGVGIPGVCDGLQRQMGCERCGRAKTAREHFGAPASYNAVSGGRGSSAAQMVGASMKQAWEAMFLDLLRETDLPRDLAYVFVEGEIVFPDHREDRDQGNFRVIIEKALGDALERGGYVANDNWDHYEFGGLGKREVPGVSATRLILFPRVDAPPKILDQMELT
jgi:hypothetical protein